MSALRFLELGKEARHPMKSITRSNFMLAKDNRKSQFFPLRLLCFDIGSIFISGIREVKEESFYFSSSSIALRRTSLQSPHILTFQIIFLPLVI